RQVEVVHVTSELPLERAALAATEQVRLVESDEAADAQALTDGRPEVHVTRALLFDVEDDVHVALLVRRALIRRRNRALEEAEVSNALPASNEPSLVVDITGNDDELVTNARLDRVVVSDDLDSVDDRRRTLVDHPPEVDDVLRRIRAG